jgi:hypothetical protein
LGALAAVTVVIAVTTTELLILWLIVATLSGVAAAFAALAFHLAREST